MNADLLQVLDVATRDLLCPIRAELARIERTFALARQGPARGRHMTQAVDFLWRYLEATGPALELRVNRFEARMLGTPAIAGVIPLWPGRVGG